MSEFRVTIAQAVLNKLSIELDEVDADVARLETAAGRAAASRDKRATDRIKNRLLKLERTAVQNHQILWLLSQMSDPPPGLKRLLTQTEDVLKRIARIVDPEGNLDYAKIGQKAISQIDKLADAKAIVGPRPPEDIITPPDAGIPAADPIPVILKMLIVLIVLGKRLCDKFSDDDSDEES